MTSYSDAYLKAHLTRICVSAADEITGGDWRRGMAKTALRWTDVLAMGGGIGNVISTFGGMKGTIAAAAALGLGVPTFLSLFPKRPVAWIEDIITGNRNHARPSPYVDVERYPDNQGNPGTDKWVGMNPDDYNKVPEGFYDPNTSMTPGYFDQMKGSYEDYRGRFGLPTNIGTSPGSFGGVGVAPSQFGDMMGTVTQRTRRAASNKGTKLVRLGQSLLTRGLDPSMVSQVAPRDNMQMAAQGAFQGWYTPGGRGDAFVDTGGYGRTSPIEWKPGGNMLETMRNRQLAMRQSNMDRIAYQTAFSLGQVANYVQSGRMTPEKASMIVQGIRNQLIYQEGLSEPEADQIMERAYSSNFAGSVPARNTGGMYGLPQLSQQQWNNPTDPMAESSWYGPGSRRVRSVMDEVQTGSPGRGQISRYNVPGFSSDNNFVPL